MGDKPVVLHSLIVIPVFKYSTNSGRTANPVTLKKVEPMNNCTL